MIQRQRGLFALLFLLTTLTAAAGPWTESGILPVTNFTTDDYNAVSQNWCAAQAPDGTMLFGNSLGVLHYDGANWRLIRNFRETHVMSLYVGKQGRIFVGGSNDFGVLEIDQSGAYVYETLLSQSMIDSVNFGDVWNILPIGQQDELVVIAKYGVYKSDGRSMQLISDKGPFRTSFSVDGRVLIQPYDQGLMELVGDQLVPLAGGEFFADKMVYGLAPEKDGTGEWVIATRGSGMYRFDGRKAEQLMSVVEEISEDYPVFNMKALGDGLYAIGTLGGGVVFVDDRGAVRRILDKTGGLQNNVVYGQYLDRQNNLWLMLSNGISRLEHASPLSYFNEVNGLEGTVQSICRHEGRLYAATLTGVYELSSPLGNNQASMWLMSNGASGASFENTNQINTECWDIKSVRTEKGQQLLVSSNDGIYRLKKGKAELIYKCLPWLITQSEVDPNRVYIGLEQGLASLYFNGRKWEPQGLFTGIKEPIRSVTEEQDGSLWVNTNGTGIIRVTYNGDGDTLVSKFDTEHGLPDGLVLSEMTTHGVIFGTHRGLYEFVPARSFFEPYDPPIAHEHIHRLKQDALGNLWMATATERGDNMETGLLYLTPYNDERRVITSTPFLEVSSSIIHAIHNDVDGTAWLGGPGGIYRYDPSINKDYDQPYQVLVRLVNAGRDSVLFAGSGQSAMPTLEYGLNTMTFSFAAPFFKEEQGIQYRYRLEGFDRQWSDWAGSISAHYTNLPEGSYTFEVVARNIYEKESAIGAYQFDILPPFYRTWWAYLLYLIAAITVVYGVVLFSTRRLKEIIRQHTAEIVTQKEVIEAKNKDITDSINYAKKIQDSFLPSHKGWHDLLPDSFALLRPKDIVSGDFKWIAKSGDYVFFTAADCTGHGVPGAFMSMVGTTFLNQVVKNQGETVPGTILDKVRVGIIEALRGNDESEQKDGMDLALCGVDKQNGRLVYSGANNPLWLVRKGDEQLQKADGTVIEPVLDEGTGYKLYEVKGDKQPVGYYPDSKPFTTHEVIMNKGTDTYYVFSDGFADQFGGQSGKKFKTRNFKKLLLNIQDTPIHEQADLLNQTVEQWRGGFEQVDDICVVGFRY